MTAEQTLANKLAKCKIDEDIANAQKLAETIKVLKYTPTKTFEDIRDFILELDRSMWNYYRSIQDMTKLELEREEKNDAYENCFLSKKPLRYKRYTNELWLKWT